MATAAPPIPLGSSARPDALVPITVAMYQRMIGRGDLVEGSPIELLDGTLVRKDRSARGEDPLAIGLRHRRTVERIRDLKPRLTALGLTIQSQQPIVIDDRNAPEPDAAILLGPDARYDDRLPGAADVLVVFEVADSSLEHDRTTKLRLYVRAGIPQYVLTNLADDVIEVYTNPDPASATYASTAKVPAGETFTLALTAGATIAISAADLLGSPARRA